MVEMIIQVSAYTGKEVEAQLHKLAKLRLSFYKEYPYLYEGTEESENLYLNKFRGNKEALLLLVFDGDRVIGAASGHPLSQEEESIKKPFQDKDLNLNDYFYISEFILEEPYREEAKIKVLLSHLHEHVKKLGRFKYLTLVEVERAPNDPKKPKQFFSLDPYWEKSGFKKEKDMQAQLNYREIGEGAASFKRAAVWTKAV